MLQELKLPTDVGVWWMLVNGEKPRLVMVSYRNGCWEFADDDGGTRLACGYLPRTFIRHEVIKLPAMLPASPARDEQDVSIQILINEGSEFMQLAGTVLRNLELRVKRIELVARREADGTITW